MSQARVGARLEVVAPRHVSDKSDLGLLVLLIAISVVVHGWIISQSVTCSKDGLGYGRYGWSLFHPTHDLPADVTRNQLEIIQNNKHHPGFPLSVAVMAEIVTRAWDAPFPYQLARAVQVASAFGALLLILPSYWIGKLLCGKYPAFIIALFTQILPVFAKDASDGLSDITHLALAAFGLLFAIRGFRRPRIGQFLLAGLFSGLAYLVRPEGLSVALAITVVLALFVFTKRLPWKLAAMQFIALALGVLVAAGPYMFIIGAVTNKPSGQRIVNPVEVNPRVKMMQEGAAIPQAPALIARMIPPDVHGFNRFGLVCLTILEETSKSSHHAVLVLAIAGLFVLRKQFIEHPEWYLLLVYALIHLALLFMLGMRGGEQHAVGGYISERHTLPISFVLIYLAIAGLEPLLSRLPWISSFRTMMTHPWAARTIVLAIVISCVPALFKKLHSQHASHLEAAEYIREHYHFNDHLYDPYEWVRFYSGHLTKVIRPDWYRTAGHGYWLVWEAGDTTGPNSSPRWVATKKLLENPNAKLVFPEPGDERNQQKGTVLVYWLPFTAEEIAADAAEQKAAIEHDAANPNAPAKTRTRYGY